MSDRWDGKERRNMSQDSVDRDRLLERLDTNVSYLVQSEKNITQALVDHAKVDDVRFGKIDRTLQFQNKIIYGALGIVAFIQFLAKFYN